MQSDSKIRALEDLAAELATLRAQGKTIIHCHGTFDLLHIGHIRHFKEAAAMGDVLVVTVTPDRFINKGPGRPVFTEQLRLEAVAALEMVDFAALTRWPTAVETIHLLKPHAYVKGSEYAVAEDDITGGIVKERLAVEAEGGELRFTDGVVFSSSTLINRHMDVLPDAAKAFLATCRERGGLEMVLGWLERVQKLRVVLVGETIIDEYHYCETMGKSGKEPILASRFIRAETFMGGVLSVVNHVCGLGASASVISCLGEQESFAPFIHDTLCPDAVPHFVSIPNSPTIVKRRFVETYPFQKLFELYLMNGMEEKQTIAAPAITDALETAMASADAVLVLDYGHGLLSEPVVATLCEKAPYLAVNTQVNAGNHGFNTISKYPRADFVGLSERELRMDARNRTAPIADLIGDAASRLGAGAVYITAGRQGSFCFTREDGFCTTPAFVTHFVDRVGAGDAVFAASSLLAKVGAPAEVIGLVGNAAGAIAVQTVSNSRFLDHGYLVKYLSHLLK